MRILRMFLLAKLVQAAVFLIPGDTVLLAQEFQSVTVDNLRNGTYLIHNTLVLFKDGKGENVSLRQVAVGHLNEDDKTDGAVILEVKGKRAVFQYLAVFTAGPYGSPFQVDLIPFGTATTIKGMAIVKGVITIDAEVLMVENFLAKPVPTQIIDRYQVIGGELHELPIMILGSKRKNPD